MTITGCEGQILYKKDKYGHCVRNQVDCRHCIELTTLRENGLLNDTMMRCKFADECGRDCEHGDKHKYGKDCKADCILPLAYCIPFKDKTVNEKMKEFYDGMHKITFSMNELLQSYESLKTSEVKKSKQAQEKSRDFMFKQDTRIKWEKVIKSLAQAMTISGEDCGYCEIKGYESCYNCSLLPFLHKGMCSSCDSSYQLTRDHMKVARNHAQIILSAINNEIKSSEEN